MENTQMAALLDQEAQAAPTANQPQEDQETMKRAEMLITQARTIWQVCQADVLAVYNTDVEARNRVLSGEWDFVDVYKAMKPAAQPPAPVRSANGGANQGDVNVAAMNDDQFAKLNALLKKGGKVNMNM